MRILGVHTGIDASACLLDDGVLRYAIQEERFSGRKNHIGLPKRSIAKILEMAKLTIDQIDEVALATNYDLVSPGEEGHNAATWKVRRLVQWKLKPLYILWEDIVPELKDRAPDLFLSVTQAQRERRTAWLRSQTGYMGPVSIVDHHLCHAASGYYSSPWRDEPVLVMSKDGSGDGLCATVSIGENGQLRRIAKTKHTHSLGYLFTSVTHWMGFKAHEEEYKMAGMAPHANPKYGEPVYKQFSDLIGVEGLQFKRKVFEPLANPYVQPHLRRIFERQRFDNIAWGIEKLTEELMTTWTENAVRRTGLHKITGGGGVYMNVATNKLIRELPGVEGFFPMPTAGDTTTSIGAAYAVYAQRMKEEGSEVSIQPLGSLYLGDNFTDRDVERAIQHGPWAEADEAPPFDAQRSPNADALVADLILKGEIVTRVRGPMEFGARALGNRSILCDARDLRSVGIINRMIKSRAFWMPFAPVIMEDRADEVVKLPEYAPYMTRTFDTTPLGRKHLLAAMHQADFTVRPQILRESWNPSYYSILRAFERETGCGGMLNTSANIHGEPIVHGPGEAMRMFLRSGLRYLVLGDYLLEKKK